jgi:hypothetical protein
MPVGIGHSLASKLCFHDRQKLKAITKSNTQYPILHLQCFTLISHGK